MESEVFTRRQLEEIQEMIRRAIEQAMSHAPADDSELTVKQVAKLKNVSPRTVYGWISKGIITPRRTPGGGLRIPLKQIKGF
jgi:excisionase family DNA binding protein